jgi:hypothetical protein
MLMYRCEKNIGSTMNTRSRLDIPEQTPMPTVIPTTVSTCTNIIEHSFIFINETKFQLTTVYDNIGSMNDYTARR